MNSRSSLRSLGLALGLAGAALAASTQGAKAVPVNLDTWYEFAFDGPGTSLTNGSGTDLATNPPDGNPVVQVGDSPWTITLTGPATLTVVDLFESVDQFEILDGGFVIGQTSVAIDGGTCATDISCALADARYSLGTFLLAAGDHSLTGAQITGIPGAAVFQITAAPVPEPASLGLLGAALAGFGLFRRRKQRA